MEVLLFIILCYLPTFWLLNSILKLEPMNEFHVSFSFCISPFNLRSLMISWFPWKSTLETWQMESQRDNQTARHHLLTTILPGYRRRQIHQTIWQKNFSTPNSKVWVAERLQHLILITNTASECVPQHRSETQDGLFGKDVQLQAAIQWMFSSEVFIVFLLREP